MIRSHSALMRQAREFFSRELVGLYSFDAAPDEAGDVQRVRLRDPEVLPDIERRERRQGRFREQVWLSFGPWEIGIFSAEEKPPLGAVLLRDNGINGSTLVEGPLDPATWAKIAATIKSELSHQKEHEHEHW